MAGDVEEQGGILSIGADVEAGFGDESLDTRRHALASCPDMVGRGRDPQLGQTGEKTGRACQFGSGPMVRMAHGIRSADDPARAQGAQHPHQRLFLGTAARVQKTVRQFQLETAGQAQDPGSLGGFEPTFIHRGVAAHFSARQIHRPDLPSPGTQRGGHSSQADFQVIGVR